jgi:hypothetical protein
VQASTSNQLAMLVVVSIEASTVLTDDLFVNQITTSKSCS